MVELAFGETNRRQHFSDMSSRLSPSTSYENSKRDMRPSHILKLAIRKRRCLFTSRRRNFAREIAHTELIKRLCKVVGEEVARKHKRRLERENMSVQSEKSFPMLETPLSDAALVAALCHEQKSLPPVRCDIELSTLRRKRTASLSPQQPVESFQNWRENETFELIKDVDNGIHEREALNIQDDPFGIDAILEEAGFAIKRRRTMRGCC